MRALVVSTLVAGMALSGCTTNPYTGEQQVSKGAKYGGGAALLGAAIGAATGKNASDRRARALKGGAILGVLGIALFGSRRKRWPSIRVKACAVAAASFQ